MGRDPLPLAGYQRRRSGQHLPAESGLSVRPGCVGELLEGAHASASRILGAAAEEQRTGTTPATWNSRARLLEHRDKYFAAWPFPYLKQTHIAWKLIGPFDHKGDLAAAFPPEQEIRDSYQVDGKIYRWMDAAGATIAVNHFSYDGWLPKTPQGTVYALTHVYSPRAGAVGFWINFNGPSRSTRRRQPNPERGTWSTVASKVWINDTPVEPPVWKNPGKVQQAEEAPLVDEDYFYRPSDSSDPQSRLEQDPDQGAPKPSIPGIGTFTCIPVEADGDRVREVPGLRFRAWTR